MKEMPQQVLPMPRMRRMAPRRPRSFWARRTARHRTTRSGPGRPLRPVPHGDDRGCGGEDDGLLLGGPVEAEADGEREGGLGEAEDRGSDGVARHHGQNQADEGRGDRVDNGLLLGADVHAESGEELHDDGDEAKPERRFTLENHVGPPQAFRPLS
jgi:hypothetical protein